MMAMGAMHMPVLELFRGRRAHRVDLAKEAQRHAGQRMVAIDDHLVVSNIGHGIDERLAGFARLAFKAHADFDLGRKFRARLDLHELLVIFAERVARLQIDVAGFAGGLAVQSLLNTRKNPVVAAVQILDRRLGFLDQLSLGIQQFVIKRYHRVLRYLHFPRPFMSSSTCAAWPRGLTPYSTCLSTPSLPMMKV